MRPAWYEIRAQAGEAEILIYQDIGQGWDGVGIAADQFVRDLQEVEASTVHLRINSAGGSVFEGLAIYNALRRHPARVVTHIDGLAASIASIIALAGDEVRMAENAFLMIHNAHGMTVGTAKEMREMADTLDKVGESLVGVYARRTMKPRARIAAWMDAETWFDAEEAEREGFVDAVGESRGVRAGFDLNRFRNVPEAVAARARQDAPWREAERFAGIAARIDADKVLTESRALLRKAQDVVDRYDLEWEDYPPREIAGTLRVLIGSAWHLAGQDWHTNKAPKAVFYRPKRKDQPVAFTVRGADEIAISLHTPTNLLPFVVGHEVAHVIEEENLSKEESERRANAFGHRFEEYYSERHGRTTATASSYRFPNPTH